MARPAKRAAGNASALRRAAGVARGSAARPEKGAGKRETGSAARRAAILAAALEEFSANGFAATRLDDVARRAGVAKGTIYLYFRDKETLFQELVRSMLNPVIGTIEATFKADVPTRLIADQIVELFVREIYGTRRKDVIRLIIGEGGRFPKLAEFYYREVLSKILGAVRTLLRRAAARGELRDPAIVDYPQLLGAPAIVAILWDGLFGRFEPLDLRAMLRLQFDLLFGKRSAS